ncbi:hypothetical protein RirG_206870 [Rhizophagus irregularis DAOM 197198w]|uniref:Uncharacterized protein n=1 Tax=Rhizophagus irregularis (strain DAOM 197198w) TaxID=1432141 RepID=A0A015IT63_RHIIW|nr:hypothetical protein RirG_206870 [Rhizophagus irregularis DAOM 197198w]
MGYGIWDWNGIMGLWDGINGIWDKWGYGWDGIWDSPNPIYMAAGILLYL